MIITTPAIFDRIGRFVTTICPKTVAVAPKITKTVVKPSTKATEDSTTVW